MISPSGSLHRATAVTLVLALLMTALFITISPGAEASGEGWLDGWQYRKALTIGAHAGAGTNNQLLLELHNSTGTDASATVYGIAGAVVYLDGVAHEDFREIRFTASDGSTLIDHWTWQIFPSLAKAYVWVEVPADLSASSAVIYIYWGNAEAASTSNGTATFPWFSDFNDATGLGIGYPDSVSFADGEMTISGDTSTNVYSTWGTAVPLGFVYRYKAGTVGTETGLGTSAGQPTPNGINIVGDTATAWLIDKFVGGSEEVHEVNPVSFTYTDYNVHELRVNPTGVLWNVNGAQEASWTDDMPTTALYLRARGGGSYSETWDYAFFYKIVDGGAVSVSAFGSAETAAAGSPPDASFTVTPSSGEAPLQVNFTPTNTGYGTYAWSFGDGNTSSAVSPGHTYTEAGNYTVILNVTDGGSGLSNQSSHQVTVTAAPTVTPEITSTAPATGQAGVAYQYQAACSIAVTSWYITGADFLSITSGGLIAGTPAAAGTYNVTITAATADGDATQNYLLVISAASEPEDPDPETPTITSSPVTHGKVNQSYQYQVACSMTVTAWSIAGADFLTISSSGLITGTPDAGDTGSHTVTVTAQTASGAVQQTFTLVISEDTAAAGINLDDTIPIVIGLLVLAVLLAALGALAAKVHGTLGAWRRRQ